MRASVGTPSIEVTVDLPNQNVSRLVGGTLVLLAFLGILLAFRVPQKAHPVQPASSTSYASSLPAVPASSRWPGAPYLEVRAYYASTPFFDVMQNGVPRYVKDKDRVLLNADQERRLIAAVTARLRPYDSFACFFPRHAFVFYDPLGKPVAEVDVCFQCGVVEGGPSDTPDLGALAELVSDLGLPLGEGLDAKSYRKAFDQRVKGRPMG